MAEHQLPKLDMGVRFPSLACHIEPKRGMGENFPHVFGVTVSGSERHRGRAPMRRTSASEDDGFDSPRSLIVSGPYAKNQLQLFILNSLINYFFQYLRLRYGSLR